MLAADAAHGQMTDGEFVADVHRAPRIAELRGGLRVGVQRRLRVGVEQRGQPLGVGVIGVLMGDQDRRQAGDALETVREGSRVEQHRRFATGIALKLASKHEWPKCVNCMPILWRRCRARGLLERAIAAGVVLAAFGLAIAPGRPACGCGSGGLPAESATRSPIRRGRSAARFRCIRSTAGRDWPACHRWSGDDAIVAFREAVRLDLRHAGACNNLGAALQTRRTDRGRDRGLPRGVAPRPDYVTAHYNLGNALHAAGRADQAIDAFRSAIRLSRAFPRGDATSVRR